QAHVELGRADGVGVTFDENGHVRVGLEPLGVGAHPPLAAAVEAVGGGREVELAVPLGARGRRGLFGGLFDLVAGGAGFDGGDALVVAARRLLGLGGLVGFFGTGAARYRN